MIKLLKTVVSSTYHVKQMNKSGE